MPNLAGLTFRRKLNDWLATGLMSLAAVLVIVPLIAVFSYMVYKGVGSLNWAFLTRTPAPPGVVGGGMANAIAGTMMILAIASVIGVPFGIGSGIFLSEYGRNKLGNVIRFTADLLNGVPSIVVGMTVWGLVVVTQKHFSMLAGGVALGIMMVPIITRSTEEMLLMVPQSIREAAWGLGIQRWRTTVSVVLTTAKSGIITGIMLAFARVAGETAPLMFTAFGNQYWNFRPDQPTAALSLQVYYYGSSPFDDWRRQAWAGALILIILIVGSVAAVRLVANRGAVKGHA